MGLCSLSLHKHMYVCILHIGFVCSNNIISFLVCEKGELLTTKESRLRQQMYDELSSGGHFSPALLVVREHLPSKKACLRFNIDATRIGNVSRFINHSCDGGNLSTALVRSSGVLLPRLCFFASKDITEDEELTFSYGETRLKSKGLPCFCASSCCFGMLPSEQTWLLFWKEPLAARLGFCIERERN